jgi:hypothetical protein
MSKQTIDVLKNMSQVHNSLIVREPNCIMTTNFEHNVIVVYDTGTDETFDKEFGLFDLREFLGVVSLFNPEDTEFDFKDKFVTVKDKHHRVEYAYTQMNLIKIGQNLKESARYKGFDRFDSTFSLSHSDISRITKSATVMFGGYIDDTTVQIKTGNGKGLAEVAAPEGGSRNNFRLRLADVEGSGKAEIPVTNLMVCRGDYEVSIANDRLIKLAHKDIPLFYILTLIKDR